MKIWFKLKQKWGKFGFHFQRFERGKNKKNLYLIAAQFRINSFHENGFNVVKTFEKKHSSRILPE
jgi:hypothetical protein